MKYKDQIKQVLSTSDLFQLIHKLEVINELVQYYSVNERDHFAHTLWKNLYHERIIIKSKKVTSRSHFRLYTKRDAVILYFISSWRINPLSAYHSLTQFIIWNKNHMVQSIGSLISEASVVRIIDAVNSTYQFADLIDIEKPIDILFLNNSFCDRYAFCNVSALEYEDENNMTFYEKMECTIILSCNKSDYKFADANCIVLHELGHILHYMLTQDIAGVPLGFQKMFDILDTVDEDSAEVMEFFADSFMFAALPSLISRKDFESLYSEEQMAQAYLMKKYLEKLIVANNENS